MRWARPSRRTVLIGVAVVAAAGLAGTAALVGTRHGTATTAASSSTATVARGTVTSTASASGTVQIVGTRGLSFSTSAVVTELNVKVGDTVSAGQVLARVDPSDAQDAVTAAQQQVDSASDNLTKAEQTQSSSTTTTTATCAAAAPAAYTQVTPSVSASPSASPTVRATTGPTATRQPSGGQPTSTCSGSGSRTGTGANTGSGGGSGTDSLASAQEQLNNAELTLAQAKQTLAGTVITAPIAGKVISVSGTVGSVESPGGTGFIVLGDINDTEVQAQFSEADVAQVAVGQPASITLADLDAPLTGKVAQISPSGTTSGSLVRYAVMIAFDAAPGDLLFGQSATVAVTTASAIDVLYVSSSAVHNVANGTGSVTVRANGNDEQRTVQIGLRGDRYTEIKSGLSLGERVVL